jgi:hypothetical protein
MPELPAPIEHCQSSRWLQRARAQQHNLSGTPRMTLHQISIVSN